MESDIHETLEQIGYSGPMLKEDVLRSALEDGAKSVDFTCLVEWFSKELQALCKLDDSVNAITSHEDAGTFLIELSSFLKEISCPHKLLTKGAVDQRLNTKTARQLLIVYLASELQAARMIATDQPQSENGIKVQMEESTTAKSLKAAMIALGLPKPNPDAGAKHLFSQIESTAEQRLKVLRTQSSSKVLGIPLFKGVLTEKQWDVLNRLHDEMSDEYRLRREMLLKRLDVTIQSFQWSGKAKSKVNDVAAVYLPRRQTMLTVPDVSIADVLAAREDLTISAKTSNANVRKNTQCAVNKIIIGRVPDRGGRPSEQKPPPPEMPSWQKRTEAPQGGFGGGGGGGRGGGGRGGGRGGGGGGGRGRVQGGWSGAQGHRGGGGGGQRRQEDYGVQGQQYY